MISFSQIANPWLGTVIGMGNGWEAGHALRLKPDHMIGAGQMSRELKTGRPLPGLARSMMSRPSIPQTQPVQP